MSILRIFFLGSPFMEHKGTPIKVDSRKSIALLAYLAVTGDIHTCDALATLLWPDLDQSCVRAALRRILPKIRKPVPGDWLVGSHEQISLGPSTGLWINVVEFHRLLTDLESHSHPGWEVCLD